MDLTPITEAFAEGDTPLIRTDFTNDEAWSRVVSRALQRAPYESPDNSDNDDSDHDDGARPGDGAYDPSLVVVDDRAFEGVTASSLGEAFLTIDEEYGYALLADPRTMSEVLDEGEVTLDYVDLSVPDAESATLFESFMGRSFRCVIPEIATIEANLSISNMDFHEFADSADPDGVFRGFDD